MEINWNLVKEMTLWHYEDLIKKMLKVLSYNFVQEYYGHTMKEAGSHLKKLLGYNPKYEEYMTQLSNNFQKLDSLKIQNYGDLVHRVETREKCEEFLRSTEISFEELISTLNYIFRWVLPFRNVYLSQLVETSNEPQKTYISKLRKCNIRFNLDILELARTKEGRIRLSEETEIPEAFIFDLVNRADLTRLPYMSRKTVDHLCNAGYTGIDKLGRVHAKKLKEDMKTYFNEKGIKLGSFIDIEGLVCWARAVPKIIEV